MFEMRGMFSPATSLSIVKVKPHLASCLDLRRGISQPTLNLPQFSVFQLEYPFPLKMHSRERTAEAEEGGYRVILISLFGNPKILTLVPFGFVHMTMNEKRNKQAYFCLRNSIIISPMNTVAKIADFLYILFLHHGQRFFLFLRQVEHIFHADIILL